MPNYHPFIHELTGNCDSCCHPLRCMYACVGKATFMSSLPAPASPHESTRGTGASSFKEGPVKTELSR